MKGGFYPKLAWDGARRNGRLYIPYILTGSVMVMMYYILSFLIDSPAVSQMTGTSSIQTTLPLGCWVVAVFSLIFLLYTNSFLIRQRYREFGLYSVLGMNKRNLSRLMAWECMIVGAMAIVSGLVAGIALSKAAELALMNMMHRDVTFTLSASVDSIWQTTAIYGTIYLLLLIKSVFRVRRARPLELMRSAHAGERIPKLNWLYALAGALLLGGAYYLAVSIREPLTAVLIFFAAVIMVIAATYLLFMSGSVALCRLLQRNKKYYYRPNHFVSVSSMVYRMRRNGAGLASICILLTMVLVMLSSTASMYVGVEDMLRTQYPKGVTFTAAFKSTDGISDGNIEWLTCLLQKAIDADIELDGIRTGEVPGIFTEDGIDINYEENADFSLLSYENVGYLSVIALEDYNHLTGKSETLADGECLLYCQHTSFEWNDTFTMEYDETYTVKKVLDEFIQDAEVNLMTMPMVYIVVNDFDRFVEPAVAIADSTGEPLMIFEWRGGFDMDTAEEEIATAETVGEKLREMVHDDNIYLYSIGSREANRADFFESTGSLLFLGAILSIVFSFAAVLIIYYKQISEGYEDRARFTIMRKVGMTKRDIRRSVNSQLLTVFFSPLIFAGIHLAFAFPFPWKILILFGLVNKTLIIEVMLGCFAIFGILYALVYRITSDAYYAIVSGENE